MITNVETTAATTPDDNMVAVVHQSLEKRGLLPDEHLVDKGYTDSRVLVGSWQRFGVTIVGPVADDPSWQARLDDGLTKAAFEVDWERKVVTCPAGKQSISWLPSTSTKNGMVFEARFATRDCFLCPLRSRCTRGKREPRIIGMQAREHFEALQGARRHQKTQAFRSSYAARAGIEGTHGQAISRCGLRRCRYIGLAKTRLQHVLTATAINLVRVAEWCAGIPVAKTRCSRFATSINIDAGGEFGVQLRRSLKRGKARAARLCNRSAGILTIPHFSGHELRPTRPRRVVLCWLA